MNFSQFNVIISCVGYAKQLRSCLWYWNNCLYPKDRFNIVVATSKKDIETLKLIHEIQDKIKIYPNIIEKNYHNKGFAIRSNINFLKTMNLIEDDSYLILSDADMIFPDNILNCLNLFLLDNKNSIVSSQREDIDPEDVDLFLNNYNTNKQDWVWQNLKRKVISPSPFMGWFLTYPYSISDKINYQTDHQGYDCIDWKIYGQLKSLGYVDKLLFLDNPPLHIYHGEKGKNWKGLEIN